VFWGYLAAAVTARRSWFIALAVALLGGLLIGLAGANDAGTQSPQTLPANSEAARTDAALSQFAGGDQAAALLVVTRTDGAALTPDDLSAVKLAAPPPVMTSSDGRAAIASVPLDAGLSGFALGDAVKKLRNAAKDGLPETLSAHVTGGPAFGADIANSFTGANVTLLIVTALVVAVLLIVTYRSPVLWLVPLAVIGFADRVATAVGTVVASATGLTFDGSTSGITSVLVFGAGTNYALLLISRYREELRHNADHRDALRHAVRSAGPAIVASNATVVLALLTLLLAIIPSTRSLGALAASGLVVAAVFVLLMLPPLLALCGTRLFWPFIPRTGSADTVDAGPWHRVAEAVGRRPALIGGVAIVGLAVLATGVLGTKIGLSQTEQFRVKADSVAGFDTLATHFPGGFSDPTVVIADTGRASAVQQAIDGTTGVVSASSAGRSATGLSRWSVVIDAAPASDEAFNTIAGLRNSVHAADAGALVGGSDAKALDVRDAAARDRLVVIPAILAVVLVVLYVLLRAVLAPPVLVAATVLSALAALGLGGWASIHVFGFPALDTSTPLFAFLFLVALGVDYTIFLVTRAREETPDYGTRDGMVRAVSATGGVITSAGVVLAAVFCVLGVLPLIVLTQLGIIVGLGILLDTFVVRTLVIPALFALIGPPIWWPTLSERGTAPVTNSLFRRAGVRRCRSRRP
jgi:putative drug exporter of the RND superfamily